MFKIITISICTAFCLSCSSQSIQISRKGALISLPQYYSAKGVIIKSQPFFLVSKLKYKNLYMPIDSDLIVAEKILSENFIGLNNKLNGNQIFDLVKDKGWYKDWYRQYFPYVDTNNDKMILISLLKCCHSIKKCYPDWRNQIVLKFDEDTCTMDAKYLVNLSKNTINIP